MKTDSTAMTIGLLGAAGHLGRRVIGHALQRGMMIRAISPHIATADLDPRVERATGSDADPIRLSSLLRGCDVVVMVFPADLRQPERFPTQIATVFDVARKAGISRVVGVVGSAGALTERGERLVDTDYFEETTRHYYQRVHDAWDAYRRETAPSWVAVVPAARMQHHMADRGYYRTRCDEHIVTDDPASRRYFDTSQISYGDCALAIVDEICRARHQKQFVTVGY